MNDELKLKRPKSQVDLYRRTDVLTANRETILLMMYEASIRFLRQAIECSERGNTIDKNRWIQKTQEIVNELRSTLDFNVGGEIATNLEKLYAFVSERLLKGSMENDPEPLKEAFSVLSTLNGAWEEAIASLRKERGRL